MILKYKSIRLVAEYYLKVMDGNYKAVLVASLLGMMARYLSILTFALVIKIFLSMFDQATSLKLINSLLGALALPAISIDLLSYYLLIPLFVFVILQLIIARLYLYVFRRVRRSVLEFVLLDDSATYNLDKTSVCYDYLMYGFEALIKSFEIVLFYGVLIVFIFLVNVIMGVAVIVLVPLLVFLLVYRNRKEAFVQNAIRHDRGQIDGTPESLVRPIASYDQQLDYRMNGLMAADFFGGVVLVVIFLIYVEFHNQFSGYGLIPLLLIFAIRFAVLYASELSRQLGDVLRIRTVIT